MVRKIRRMSGGLRVKQVVAFLVMALLSAALGFVLWMFLKKCRLERQYLSRISELEQELYQVSMDKTDAGADTAPVNEPELPEERLMEMEYGFINISSHIREGDYIDVRLRFPDGSDFIVVSHKQLLSCDKEKGSIVIPVTEEELLMLSSAETDKKLYTGSRIYLSRYTDASSENVSVPDYAPSDRILELMVDNPNIVSASWTASAGKRQSLENELWGFKGTDENEYGEVTEDYVPPESGLPDAYGGSIWD